MHFYSVSTLTVPVQVPCGPRWFTVFSALLGGDVGRLSPVRTAIELKPRPVVLSLFYLKTTNVDGVNTRKQPTGVCIRVVTGPGRVPVDRGRTASHTDTTMGVL